jgi:hypothetical protein
MGDTRHLFRVSVAYYGIQTQALARLSLLASLDTFLEAAFLWMAPFAAAWCNLFSAKANFSFAVSSSPVATADSKPFTIVLRWDFTRLFRAVFFAITPIRFFADFIFAISYLSFLNHPVQPQD